MSHSVVFLLLSCKDIMTLNNLKLAQKAPVLCQNG